MAEIMQGRPEIPLNDLPDVINLPVIGFGILKPFTGTQAIAQVILQAKFVFAGTDLFFRQVIIAGSQRINAFYQIQKSPDRFHLGIGPEILRSVPYAFTGWKNTRETFIFDTKPWIGFIVSEQDIISWLVLLDQVIFQKQRIRFGRNHNVFYTSDFPDHYPCFSAVMGLGKIRTDPFLQILCLPHV
jgi:hypothetical protein